ncbi:3-hydroxyacyl-CoA dehydrogenase family protein [Salinispora pacifica]|uniref:3-hydroxyacyl-CoA dehydrogenase family protein n=1 Tax=Salinispora pacifica TaxID=351187 RepID=UPI00035FC718|nr:3-hydroxyacyl-CoA dehydrogenase family protein [Salinispora pacifica]
MGTGVMGAGIAQVAAMARHEVIVCTRSARSAGRARQALDAALRRAADRGFLKEDPERVLARVSWHNDLSAAGPAAIVVESAPEDLALKQEIFETLGRVCSPTAVLASNTSQLPITQIAAVTAGSERVVGTHFFSPVPARPLCEVVRGEKTSASTVERARDFVAGLGKTCIVIERDTPGFVTTRLMAVLVMEAARLADSGIASARDIDLACRLGFGHRMGPLETADLAGVDTMVDVADGLYTHHGEAVFMVPDAVRAMVAAGRRGRKSGAGFHDYGDGTR